MIHQWYNGTLINIIVLNDLHINTPLIYMAPKYLIEYHGITIIVQKHDTGTKSKGAVSC